MARLVQVLLIGRFISMTRKNTMRLVVLKPNKDMAYLNELFEGGKIKPVLDKLHTLSGLPEAMRYFGAADHKGKVVISMDGPIQR